MDNEKYHHLVPSTYLKAWVVKNNSINTLNLVDGRSELRNRCNFMGENHFHSIKAGMPICTEEDCKILFEDLYDYKVIYKEKVLSIKEYNTYFSEYDDWIIQDKFGQSMIKKQKNDILNKVMQNKVNDIEKNWNIEYECKWETVRNMIINNTKDTSRMLIDEFMKGYLIKWMVSLDWRSFKSNDKLNNSFEYINDILNLSKFDIEFNERPIISCDNANKEMKHYYKLKNFRKFLSKTGEMYEQANYNIKNTTLQFIISNDLPFITSDNPSFSYKENNKNTILMPVTPNILMSIINKRNDGKYIVTEVSRKKVRELNNLIKDNAVKHIICNKTSFKGLY